jgi:hypothetical protein
MGRYLRLLQSKITTLEKEVAKLMGGYEEPV